MEREKEIRWIGSSYQNILDFPPETRKEVGHQLGKVQAGAGRLKTVWRSGGGNKRNPHLGKSGYLPCHVCG